MAHYNKDKDIDDFMSKTYDEIMDKKKKKVAAIRTKKPKKPPTGKI